MNDAQAPGPLPLEGYLVVALEQAVAAPLATRHLADLGARVIKIERVGEGDFARAYDDIVRGQASHFVWLNRGKESVAVDLKSEDGVALVRELVDRADVFVQNLAPGSVDRLGLGADELRRRNSRLVVVNLSGYGTAGPMRDRRAYDLLVQAESGLVSVNGTPETAAKTGIPASDIAAGMYACNSAVSALLRRERFGVGSTVDVSMFDATVEWLGHPMYVQMYANRQVPRMGLSHVAIAPYDAFPTSDGEILIGVQNDRGWRNLVVDVFDRPDLADDPDLLTNRDRVRNRAKCDAAVAAETAGWTTRDLDDRLAEVGIAAAQVRDIAGLVAHPQLHERDRWREVGTPEGPVAAVLPPMTFRDIELRMGDVPALGAHTDAVLAEFGYGDRIEELRRLGVVG